MNLTISHITIFFVQIYPINVRNADMRWRVKEQKLGEEKWGWVGGFMGDSRHSQSWLSFVLNRLYKVNSVKINGVTVGDKNE